MLVAFVNIPLLAPAQTFTQGEPWLEHYSGSIPWKREKDRLDNFAIQIVNNPQAIGYILIYSGEDSCSGEAEARAIQIKQYLMVRGVPWNRAMWQHGGRYRGDGLRIHTVPIPRAGLVRDFRRNLYEPPPEGHRIKPCSSDKKNVPSGAANKRLQPTPR